jgi:hypothetical protein
MTDGEIINYLKVMWLDEEEVRRLARHLGVKFHRKHAVPGALKKERNL